MNIFEELAESYTYNGVVSLKALDDDIVTLENQIDSYNATLKELQVRGKKVGPIVNKIRDAKIRLSLLKAVYKKESEKATPEDVILNMLGVSANNAKETNSVDTAADGREPKQQNFISAELEKNIKEQLPIGTNVKITENDSIANNKSIVVEEESSPKVKASVLEDMDLDKEIIIADENTPKEELKGIYSSLADKDAIIVRNPESTVKIEQEELTDMAGAGVNAETNVKEIEVENVPAAQIAPEKDIKNTNIEKNVFDVAAVETASFPTTDDFCETETGSSPEEITYIEGGPAYNCSNEENLPEKLEAIPDNPMACCITDNPSEVIIQKEDSTETDCEESNVYEAFCGFDRKIYVSFDLCPYTDMVNTNSVTGIFNEKNKVLEVTFNDVRDYSIFTFLLNEKNQKHQVFDRFLKKPKSIIMYVRTEIDGNEKEYRYEFTDCHLIEILDSKYLSMRESTYYPTSTHEFHAKFKYKRLKIG